VNKKFIQASNNHKFIDGLINVILSLSFDPDVGRKIVTKDFVNNLSEMLLRIKNENILYNTLFIFRNISFLPTNKLHFVANENLLGMIFAFLSGDYSNKVKFIISHLIWVLLYNNQTLKGILCKDEFKTELKSVFIHLQKE